LGARKSEIVEAEVDVQICVFMFRV